MIKVLLGAALLCLACVSSVPAPPSRSPAQDEQPPAAPPRTEAAEEPTRREPLVVRPGGYKMADLPVFSKVLFYVQENYYDKNRIDPKRMLLGALEFVQRDVPEIVIEPLPIGAPNRVAVTVSGESRTFRIDRVDQAWSLRSRLQEILRFTQARLQPVPEADEGRRLLDIEMSAANGMLYTLDPHSVLIDPAAYADMRGGAERPAGAIGVTVELDVQHRVQVTGVVPGAPAERAGVRVGDRIIRINDELAASLTLEDVAKRFPGAIGSSLDLHVERDGARGLQKVHVERAPVHFSSIDAAPRILTAPAGPGAPPAKVGYFHLKHLAADASGAVERALEGFARERVGGIVLDLRGNGGGLYAQAVRVADAFVKQGTLVSMVGVGAKQRKDELARDDGTEPEVPVVVLVDHDTASGAEIIAAALRGLDRAVILGQHTFGEGTVQVLFDIASPLVSPGDGAPSSNLGLKLTTAQFLTTGNAPIQLRGVAPDVELRGVTFASGDQRTLFRMEPAAPKGTEGAYEWALASTGTEGPAARPLMTLDYLTAPPTSEPIDGTPAVESWSRLAGDDFVAVVAAELVARIRQPGRTAALNVVKPFVAEVAAREDARIAAAAAALKVDWGAGARTAIPRLALKIEPGGGGAVRAGTRAMIRGTVTNSGVAPAFRVRAVLISDDPAFDGPEMPFGRVAPGESKTFDLAVPIPPTTFTRTDLVWARLRDAGGDVAGGAAETTVAVEARPAPALSFTCRAMEAKPRGGPPGSASIKLVMQIRNPGTVAAEQAEATVGRARGAASNDDGVVFRVSRWSGPIAAGAKKEVTFVVDLPAAPRGGPLDLDLKVAGAGLYESVSARMGLIAGPTGSWQVTPPTVSATPPVVTVTAPAVTADNTVHVAGEVNADTAARDVYIRVWNRSLKMPVRKVFYRNAPANSSRLPFEVDVPIWPGNNIVTVHARDARGTEAIRTVVVLKRTDQPPAR